MSKVLIVDSDVNEREFLGNYLSEKGFEIILASDGEEGLSKALQIQPEVVILETMLPRISGIEVLKKLKEDPRTRAIPVLILTKYKSPEVRREATGLGVTIFFEKEATTPENLSGWIQELIGIEKEEVQTQVEVKPGILLVEDDPLMINLYQRALSYVNLVVDVAKDGEEALKKVSITKPAVILLDIMMPKMDGFAVLKTLKANPQTKDIPVIILTNLAEQRDVEMAMSLGAVKYIIKSEQEPGEVVKIVKEVLSGNSSGVASRIAK